MTRRRSDNLPKPTRPGKPAPRPSLGFTLIELMIVVAIIGILAAIAYPSYLSHVREARRVDAKSLLLKAASEEEKYYSVHNQYTASMMDQLGLPSTTANGFYAVSASVSGTNNDKYTIAATAQADQLNDTCRTMAIDQTGAKRATDASGQDVSGTCW